jgi:hypothetical protein
MERERGKPIKKERNEMKKHTENVKNKETNNGESTSSLIVT